MKGKRKITFLKERELGNLGISVFFFFDFFKKFSGIPEPLARLLFAEEAVAQPAPRGPVPADVGEPLQDELMKQY